MFVLQYVNPKSRNDGKFAGFSVSDLNRKGRVDLIALCDLQNATTFEKGNVLKKHLPMKGKHYQFVEIEIKIKES